MAGFGSYGSVTNRSGALQMARESAIDCLAVYEIDYTGMSFFCYNGSAWKNKGMWGNTEISYSDPWKDQDMLLMFYLYTLAFTCSLIFWKNVSE